MINVLVLSSNDIFKNDLKEKINNLLTDYIATDETDPDIIVIDEPSGSLDDLKKKHPQTPIIFFAKKNDPKLTEDSFVKYVQKPFSLNSFFDTLQSSINFMINSKAGILSFNGYLLFSLEKELQNTRTNEKVKLTEREVSMLSYLYKTKDKITSKTDFLKEVWGYNPEVSTHTIETHVYRLRQKVEKNENWPQLITTENGGYKLNL